MRDRFDFRFGPSWARAFATIGHIPRRMKRGDIKYLLLEVLKEGPKHGYDIIGELENRYTGYRPSPGSVYPTLQMLEEGGFVTGQEVDGKKVYTITDAGLKMLEERGDRGCCGEEHRPHRSAELWKSLGKLAMAVTESSRSADEEVVKHIGEILDKARREVYSVLAES